MARIRAILRRGQDLALTVGVIEADGVRIDVERHQVDVDGQEVRLALREFELLELLLRNAGHVITRGQIIDRIWGSDYVGDTKTLDVHIKRLRSKIERDPLQPPRVSSPCAAWGTSSRADLGRAGGRVQKLSRGRWSAPW